MDNHQIDGAVWNRESAYETDGLPQNLTQEDGELLLLR